MQFKVPQNVQIEDRILPFMTLRQLIICGVGGGFTYLIYLSLEHQNPEIWIPPVMILGALTLAIAFLKIQDIRFTNYLLFVLERYLTEQKRVWQKSAGDLNFLINTNTKKKIHKKKDTKKEVSIKDLDKLTKMIDG
jgi:hypothetical protein